MEWQETSWFPKDVRKKCTNAKFMLGNIEDLHKIWSPVDVCYKRPAEGLLSIVNFRRYRTFDNVAVKEFDSLLRDTIEGAKSVSLLKMLVSKQTLAAIMGRDADNRLELMGHGQAQLVSRHRRACLKKIH